MLCSATCPRPRPLVPTSCLRVRRASAVDAELAAAGQKGLEWLGSKRFRALPSSSPTTLTAAFCSPNRERGDTENATSSALLEARFPLDRRERERFLVWRQLGGERKGATSSTRGWAGGRGGGGERGERDNGGGLGRHSPGKGRTRPRSF